MVEFENNKHRHFYLKNTVKQWKEKNALLYKNKLEKIPRQLYLRIITNEYKIYYGLLNSLKNNEINLYNTYYKQKYIIPFDKLKRINDGDEFETHLFVGVYLDHEKMKQKQKEQTEPEYS